MQIAIVNGQISQGCCECLSDLDAICYPENQLGSKRVHDRVNLGNSHLVVATDEDMIDLFGFALVRCPRNVAQLSRLGVHPDHRRKGVGREILGVVAAMGVAVRCCVGERDLIAQLFLRDCGMRGRLVRNSLSDDAMMEFRALGTVETADTVAVVNRI